MNVLYEEDGAIKVASVMADNTSSLQVETPHGKRSKIKAGNVLLRFEKPPMSGFMDAADAAAGELDTDFLWQCCSADEFMFNELAQEYYGHAPNPVEAAAVALRLHSAPMYFYKKGKGRYKAAPEENLKAALASEEKKRQQAATVASYVEQLCASTLPDAFTPQVIEMLLYREDKNTLEYKALEKACAEMGLLPVKLLEQCGAIPCSHDFHYKRFILEHFPRGTEFENVGEFARDHDLPLAKVQAFSIDDAATTEIDDAFSVERLPNGNWHIGIHIAAPALGFGPGSDLDNIALQRLSTIYMPGRKITMLPDEVVNCFTLNEGTANPALSMYLEVTPDEYAIERIESRVERVHIATNLRHDTLEPVFNTETLAHGNTPDFAFKAELEMLWQFSNRLEQARGKADSQNQYKDYNFIFENERVDIIERPRGSPIDKVVSELMIQVNSHWAKQLSEAGVAAIYRSQGGGKVRMSTSAAPHQGLGVAQYAWSSSPLRRYVDLLNQRQLIALINGQEPPYAPNSEDLFSAIRDFEQAYDAYNNVQRSMERYWCLRYLQQEGMSTANATLIKENLVRFDRLPLVTRAFGMPELAPGTRVELELSAVDLLELEVRCKFHAEKPVELAA
ncbi:MAG: RNB domain-containing ribonuclease [Pseudomonadota bacterium]|nr:RNB domain-containing ribonuclease [Gammaproteobacteria bacterium]MBU1733136.1 RNB domain-containing ribonuclease [Gammaproteobacteria bacterium]MBU1892184.1 RNB domain-containing ribonuclease [Gammaproteobacteria bacterium]